MPQHVVAVVVHVDAGIERRRHPLQRLLIGLEVVERMGQRMDAPGILGVLRDAALGPAHRLFAVALFLEDEGEEAVHEGILGQRLQQRLRQLPHLGEAPLEEPHQIEPLRDHQILGPGTEMGAHGGFGVAGAEVHVMVQRRDLAPLALGTPVRRPPCRGHCGARLGKRLLDEMGHRKTRMRGRQIGVAGDRVAEEIHRPAVPGQQTVHAPVERGNGVSRGGRQGETVGVRLHDVLSDALL